MKPSRDTAGRFATWPAYHDLSQARNDGVHVTSTQVIIDRILYGGRDLPALFNEASDG